EELLRLLRLDVRAQQPGELALPFGAPREFRLERLGERALRVDAMRIDREAGVLARKALALLRESELLAFQIDQVRRIPPVDHRETRIEPEHVRVFAQQPVADR